MYLRLSHSPERTSVVLAPPSLGGRKPGLVSESAPGCAQASPHRHRRCTAPVRFPAALGRCPRARRTHNRPGDGVPALQAGKSVLSVSRSASLSSSPPTRASVSTLPTMRVPGSSGPRAVPGQGWLLPGNSLAQELHEHQGLDPVAHAHAPREGSRGRSSVLEGAGGMAKPPVLCSGTLHNQCLHPVDQFLHLPVEGLSIQP
jgi:hypothetical protein